MRAVLLGFALSLLSMLAHAQSWRSGAADDGEYLYAVTSNDSDGLFGQFCYPDEGSCVWLVAGSTGCDEGSTYPVLVSANVGAFHANLTCRGPFRAGNATYHRYVIDQFDSTDEAVRSGGQVAIAFPLKSGQFRVMRFSVTGAPPVIDRMRTAAETAMSRQRRGSTRDRVL